METKTNLEELSKEQLSKYVSLNFQKIRDCDDYNTEYKECTCIKGRFNQYFVHGDVLDCSNYKKDYNNCRMCYDRNDLKACVEVIKSADKLLDKRMKAYEANDVWEKRTEPPEDWNKPLPDDIVQQNSFALLEDWKKNSYKLQYSCTIF